MPLSWREWERKKYAKVIGKYWSFKVVMGLFVTRSRTQIDYLIFGDECNARAHTHTQAANTKDK